MPECGTSQAPDIPPSESDPSRLRIVVAGALSSGITAVALSNDWCCVAFSASIAGALTVGLADGFVWARRLTAPNALQIRLAIAVLTGFVLGLLFRLDPDAAFEEAFGMKPPDGVRHLRVERHYAGGPGDVAMLIEFTASPEVINMLVGGQRFDSEEAYADWSESAGQGWPELWKRTFGSYDTFADDVWQNVEPMSQPMLFRANATAWPNDSGLRGTTLLWDAESGRAYALYTFG